MIRSKRKERGFTQSDLANKAGISRSAVACIEAGTMVPSVISAIAIAKALGCLVEDLFDPESLEPVWCWEPPRFPHGYWRVQVGRRDWLIPCEDTHAGVIPMDGWFDGKDCHAVSSESPKTLLIACCDPAIGLLSTLIHKRMGFRVIPLYRSSGEALDLLSRGIVHAAGLHFGGIGEAKENADFIIEKIGKGHQLLRCAVWQEGVVVPSLSQGSSIKELVNGKVRWLGREEGTGARICQDMIFESKEPPLSMARDHQSVVTAIRHGWADAGICQQYMARQEGMAFLPVRAEAFDFCFPTTSAREPGIQALITTVGTKEFRDVVEKQSGYQVATTGDLVDV